MIASTKLTSERKKALDEFVDELLNMTKDAGRRAKEAALIAGATPATIEQLEMKPDISSLLRDELRSCLREDFAMMDSAELAKRKKVSKILHNEHQSNEAKSELIRQSKVITLPSLTKQLMKH